MEPEIAPRLVGRTKKSGLRHAWLNRPVMLAVPSALLFALASMDAEPACAASSSVSQTAQNSARAYNIPSLPLGLALATYGKQTGVQVTYDPALLAGKTSVDVSGSMNPQEALQKLLSSSNLSYRYADSNTVVIQKSAANITLGPVRVGGTLAHQDPTGPGVGYVADRTMSATKTDTPLTEIPNSVYVITKQQILDQQPQNVAEALRYTAGVYAEGGGTHGNGASMSNGGYAMSQRGFDTTEFVDGLMSRSFAAGETSFLDRIEVVNGPASVMYGQVTPGGMIGMSLKKPTDTALHQVSIGFGNWGRYEATVDVSDKITKSGDLRYRIAAIGVTQGTQTDHVDYHRVGVLPSITWDIDNKTSLTLLGSYMYTPGDGLNTTAYPALGTVVTSNGLPRISRSTFLSTPNWNKHGEKDAMFEYQFKHEFNKFINFSQTFRWEESQRTSAGTFFDGALSQTQIGIGPWNQWSDGRQEALDTRIFGKVDTGPVKHTWVVGSDFRNYNYVLGNDYDYPNSSGVLLINPYNPQTNYEPCYSRTSTKCHTIFGLPHYGYFQEGVYFQDQMRWKDLSILIGGRQDWVNYSTHSSTYTNKFGVTRLRERDTSPQPQSAFTWRGGIIYNFNFGLTPYFSYSTSFIPQTGTNWQGQPFNPLTGKQMEAGLKYKIPGKEILFTASAFHIIEDHYLISDLVHTNYSADAGTVRSQGFELSANANITRNLRLVASYTFEDVRFRKNNLTAKPYNPVTMTYGSPVSEENKFVPQLPRNMVNMFVDYTFKDNFARGFGVNGGVRYVGSTYAGYVEAYKVPSYVLFDIGAHYDFGEATSVLKGLRAQLAVSNLTNKYYVTACGTYQCYLGQGRRVYGNLTYNW
ncbi:ferric siderophore receptor [Acetobacter cibinongensis]|uniref:Ferric siderophore receptor n=1 Tax=Acetobacter cibinongensis TaxID=146475 RepID=A0A0D6N7N3_9PROT|nr:TonB-dependent siderophore receptor [Acetobacter cibinongensis]GAN61700.1 outer membrane siderophore receptor [Acetobacter cibinongensis]GBQ15519.1 ferric iron siderophore receptor [Acetobacter cibinongensis NRIC 0482]GEL59953.1 ferric siderophore receptor [Acetobacter cibinongensis]